MIGFVVYMTRRHYNKGKILVKKTMSENDNVSVSANNKVPMSTIISGDV